MKKKLLSCALLGAMSMAQSVMAQDYDDRWYLTAGAGFNVQDSSRNTEDAIFGTIGIGRYFYPNWSFDLDFNTQNPKLQNPEPGPQSDLRWPQYGVSLDLRRHFNKEGRNWGPYLVGGIGAQKHDQEFDAFPDPNSPGHRDGTNLAVKLGAGLEADVSEHFGIRTEFGVRFDADDTTYNDFYAGVTGMLFLGDRDVAVTPVTPVMEKGCADLDDDGDGVNNCNDKCPGSEAGQAIGPDGCPVPLTIDLKGVNFDFDKSTLRPDAVVILDEAVSILAKYPQLRVEVAGHTDSIGSDAYNQGLSERRARTVYDYLAAHGVDAGRMVGPVGYGETKPIDDNATKEGRARNRRTELNVQN